AGCFGESTMPGTIAIRALALAAALISLPAAAQMVPDPIYAAGFEAADIPATDAEAARFLTQASFGPTRREIAKVRAIGYAAWIDQQLATPATLAQPYLASLAIPSPPGLTQSNRMDRWFSTA